MGRVPGNNIYLFSSNHFSLDYQMKENNFCDNTHTLANVYLAFTTQVLVCNTLTL